MVDTKTYDVHREGADPADVPAGTPLHEMHVRIVVDVDYLVHDAAASIEASPFSLCREAEPGLAQLKDLRTAAGWNKAVDLRLGGVKGCAHVRDLLPALATAAFQTLHPYRAMLAINQDPKVRPALLESCLAYAPHTDVVKARWPMHWRPKE